MGMGTLGKALSSGMVTMGVGMAAGGLGGALGERRGRNKRVLAGMAHGAVLGAATMRYGGRVAGFQKAFAQSTIFRNHVIGAGVGAIGGYALGYNPGSTALIGAGFGHGFSAYGMGTAAYGARMKTFGARSRADLFSGFGKQKVGSAATRGRTVAAPSVATSTVAPGVGKRPVPTGPAPRPTPRRYRQL